MAKVRKSKLEILEDIEKSDQVIGTEKFCLYCTDLPEEIKEDILNQVTGMINMAKFLANK